MGKSIILFDGVCNLCSASVNFVIRNDPEARFQFAAIQSEAGLRLSQQIEISADMLEAVVLWEDDQVYTASTAALRIARKLRFPWPLLYVFVLVPPVVRDAIYAWVARNRYRWFGKQNTCYIPPNHLR